MRPERWGIRFALGRDPMSENSAMPFLYCISPECRRSACTSSQEGYAQYCCKACADGNGHGADCDRVHGFLEGRVIGEYEFISYELAKHKAGEINAT